MGKLGYENKIETIIITLLCILSIWNTEIWASSLLLYLSFIRLKIKNKIIVQKIKKNNKF